MYQEWGGPSLEHVYEKLKNLNTYRGSYNLFTSLGIFGPLKIFYGQKIAGVYIGKKEAILGNVHAKKN